MLILIFHTHILALQNYNNSERNYLRSELNSIGTHLETDSVGYPCDLHLFLKNWVS
jgi:hypothetical protein